MKITVETQLKSTLEKAWYIYTTPEHIKKWNAASDDWHTTAASVDLRVGGEFSSRMEAKDGSFGFDFAGTYTQVKPQQLLEYEFAGRTCSVVFIAEQDSVTVQVTFDAEDENPVDMQREGWQAILNNFKKYAEAEV